MGIQNQPRHLTCHTASSDWSCVFILHSFETNTNQSTCVSVSRSTSDKPVSRSVTPAGSCTVLSTVSSLMVRCQVTRPPEVEMIPSTPSSVKLELESTSQEPSSSILNQLSSMRSVPVPTVNCSTPNSWSLAKRMPLTTTLVVTTPSVRKSSTLSSTESESLPINVPV